MNWILPGLLLFIFTLLAGYNFKVLLAVHILRGKWESWIPFFGGIAGSAGVYLLPIELFPFAWVTPLFLDWGSIPGTLYSIWHIRSISSGRS